MLIDGAIAETAPAASNVLNVLRVTIEPPYLPFIDADVVYNLRYTACFAGHRFGGFALQS